MRLLRFSIVLLALFLFFSMWTSTNSNLSCQPSFPTADIAGSEVLVDACTLIRSANLIMTTLNITEEEHVRYINPKLPNILSAMDSYASFVETQHGCHASHQEKIHCTWIAQLRGEITQYIARIEGKGDDGRNKIDLAALITANSIAAELKPMISGIQSTMTEFLALDPHNANRALSVLSVLSEKYERFQKSIKRAEGLEPDFGCPQHGLPMVCDLFRRIREIGKGVEEMLDEHLGKTPKHVKEEIRNVLEDPEDEL